MLIFLRPLKEYFSSFPQLINVCNTLQIPYMFQSPLCMVDKCQYLNCYFAVHHSQVSWRVKLTIFEVRWQELQNWSLKKNFAFETHPSTVRKRKKNTFIAILDSLTFNKCFLKWNSWIICFNYSEKRSEGRYKTVDFAYCSLLGWNITVVFFTYFMYHI